MQAENGLSSTPLAWVIAVQIYSCSNNEHLGIFGLCLGRTCPMYGSGRFGGGCSDGKCVNRTEVVESHCEAFE